MKILLLIMGMLASVASCKTPEEKPFDWEEFNKNHAKPDAPSSDIKWIEPTVELGAEGEDISHLRYRIGVSVNIVDETAEKDIKALHDAGIEYIELKFKYSTFKFREMTDSQVLEIFTRVKGYLEKYDVKVWSCHLPYDDKTWTNPGAINEQTRQQSEEYLARVIRLTEMFHVKSYVLHAGKGTIGEMSTAVAQAQKTIRALKVEADKVGGRLCIENLVGSLAYLWSDVDAIVGPLEGVWKTVDVGHANITQKKAGGISPVEFVRRSGTRLGAIHIDDNLGSDDNHLLPGRGTIQGWDEIYRAMLNDCRYRGVYIFEPSGSSYSPTEAATWYREVLLPMLEK